MKQKSIEQEAMDSARAVAIGLIVIAVAAILAIAAIADAGQEEKEYSSYCDKIMLA